MVFSCLDNPPIALAITYQILRDTLVHLCSNTLEFRNSGVEKGIDSTSEMWFHSGERGDRHLQEGLHREDICNKVDILFSEDCFG